MKNDEILLMTILRHSDSILFCSCHMSLSLSLSLSLLFFSPKVTQSFRLIVCVAGCHLPRRADFECGFNGYSISATSAQTVPWSMGTGPSDPSKSSSAPYTDNTLKERRGENSEKKYM